MPATLTMGDVHLQYEFEVLVPQPRPPDESSGVAPGAPTPTPTVASAAGEGDLCPLKQPSAYDWVPSLAVLSDAGLEVGGVVLSLLDIVAVRVVHSIKKNMPDLLAGTKTGASCGDYEETEASSRDSPAADDTGGAAAAPTAATASGAAAAAVVAEKENVLWPGDKRETPNHILVCLRSPLPSQAADPPLYPAPSDADPDVGSCIILRTAPQQKQQLPLPLGGAAAEAGGGSLSPSRMRYSSNSSAAAAVLLLQRLQEFISRVRPVFCSLRKRAAQAEEIRSKVKVKQLQQQEHQQFFATELQSLGDKKQLEALLGGFLLRDCAALEEAVAYAPLSVYVHLESATSLLPQLPVEPSLYATWKRVMLQQRRLQLKQHVLDEQRSAGRLSSPGSSLRGAPRSPLQRGGGLAAAAPAATAAAAPFALQGGGCRLAKGSSSCCEDAFFCLEAEGAFGVFDGVGSWAVEGIDASRFSEGLADACAAEARRALHPQHIAAEYAPLDANGRARLLLQRGHEVVCNSNANLWGSSTAAVGYIDRRTGRLGVACLGDSVLMVLRRQLLPSSMSFFAADAPSPRPETVLSSSCCSKVPRLVRRCCWRTKEQRWENGAPYQLCNLPPRSSWEALKCQGYERFVSVLERIDPHGDTADMAYAPPQPLLLQPGDLLLVFSDGVADNVFDKELEIFSSLPVSPDEAALLSSLQQQQLEKQHQHQHQQTGQEQQQKIGFTPAQDVAELIVKIAKRKSADGLFERPFVSAPEGTRALPAHLAQGAEGEGPRGGKRDDISCVAVWVTAANPAHGSPAATPAAAGAAAAAAGDPTSPMRTGTSRARSPQLCATPAATAAPAPAPAAPATPESLRRLARPDGSRTPTSSSRRQSTPSPTTPASPAFPAIASTETPSKQTPTRGLQGRSSPKGPLVVVPQGRVGSANVWSPGSPTSTPRKPLSVAAAAPAAAAGVQGASRLPRPSFAALAVLRAAAVAVRGNAEQQQQQRGSPKRAAARAATCVGSPGPRYSDTPKKLLRPSSTAAAAAAAGPSSAAASTAASSGASTAAASSTASGCDQGGGSCLSRVFLETQTPLKANNNNECEGSRKDREAPSRPKNTLTPPFLNNHTPPVQDTHTTPTQLTHYKKQQANNNSIILADKRLAPPDSAGTKTRRLSSPQPQQIPGAPPGCTQVSEGAVTVTPQQQQQQQQQQGEQLSPAPKAERRSPRVSKGAPAAPPLPGGPSRIGSPTTTPRGATLKEAPLQRESPQGVGLGSPGAVKRARSAENAQRRTLQRTGASS